MEELINKILNVPADLLTEKGEVSVVRTKITENAATAAMQHKEEIEALVKEKNVDFKTRFLKLDRDHIRFFDLVHLHPEAGLVTDLKVFYWNYIGNEIKNLYFLSRLECVELAK